MTKSQSIDLHCHSTASDGTLSPTHLLQLAQRCNLSALSLTDHDTIAGIDEAQREAHRLGIDFLPGIEISCEFPYPGTMHLLGYGIDPASPVLLDMTRQLIDARDNRNPKIIQKLNQANVFVTMEEWEREAGGLVVGRPHLASILLRKGYVSSIKQAFDKYLGQGGIAYTDKERLSPRRAIELIRQSNGLPVLAHPVQLRYANNAQLELTLKNLVDLGLAGLEVIHSDHPPDLVDQFSHLADHFHLLKTGGSDFHGLNLKEIQLGQANHHPIPRLFFDTLLAHLPGEKSEEKI